MMTIAIMVVLPSMMLIMSLVLMMSTMILMTMNLTVSSWPGRLLVIHVMYGVRIDELFCKEDVWNSNGKVINFPSQLPTSR